MDDSMWFRIIWLFLWKGIKEGLYFRFMQHSLSFKQKLFEFFEGYKSFVFNIYHIESVDDRKAWVLFEKVLY